MNWVEKKLREAMVETRRKVLRGERTRFRVTLILSLIAVTAGTVGCFTLPFEPPFIVASVLLGLIGLVGAMSSFDRWERAKKLLS